MKRNPNLILFSVIILAYMTSCSNKKYFNEPPDLNALWTISTDSTSLIALLKIDTFNLPVFPPSSGVQFYRDGIVFLSTSKYDKKMAANQISFGTLATYYAPLQDSTTGKRQIFSPSATFWYPSEAMTFTRNWDTVYYTRLSKNDNKEKIYLARILQGSGLLQESLPTGFCTGASNYSHPAITEDGKTIVFASDRVGTLGGMDLFVSHKNGSTWTTPENLGKSINTEGNEFYPFIDSYNNLYYSSDKLPGYGGYDIYTCRYTGSGWKNPVNLTSGFNTGDDEIAFTISKADGETAFFTRRQRSGKKEMILFKVFLKPEALKQNIFTVSDAINTKHIDAIAPVAVSEPQKETKESRETIAQVTKQEAKTVAPTEKAISIPRSEKTTKAVDTVANKKVVPSTVYKPTDLAENNVTPNISGKETITYRVQIFSSSTKKNNKEISLSGNSYQLYEYLYNGAYRYTVGEFHELKPAVELQLRCRQSGYPEAFVVAFKNGIRSLDKSLFK